jgi:hypothetical protein
MGDRFRASWSGLLIATALAALAMPIAAQPPAATTKAWTPPRTSDGHPDLQGFWLSKTATPLERPKALEGKPLLTDAEVAALKANADRIFKNGVSDFAAGDAVFLTALADPAQFKSPTSTHGAEDMIDREFDHHTSLVVDPPDGHIPPLTAEARRRREAAATAARRPDGPEDLDNAFRCIAWGVPRLGGRYGAGDLGYYQIVQTPGYVLLYMETGHEARIIPLDGRPHLSASARQWGGDSRGRWDGNTLVIDTVSFSPKSNFMGSAQNLHLVERLTRIASDTINYAMTFDDPTTWTRPWTAEMPLKRTDQALYEYACHEGNFVLMTGLLAGAHAADAHGVPR